MALRNYWIVRVKKEDNEKLQTFYTSSRQKIDAMKEAGFTMKVVCQFSAAVMSSMTLSPLPSPPDFIPVQKT